MPSTIENRFAIADLEAIHGAAVQAKDDEIAALRLQLEERTAERNAAQLLAAAREVEIGRLNSREWSRDFTGPEFLKNMAAYFPGLNVGVFPHLCTVTLTQSYRGLVLRGWRDGKGVSTRSKPTRSSTCSTRSTTSSCRRSRAASPIPCW
jgi:hypothetical protein